MGMAGRPTPLRTVEPVEGVSGTTLFAREGAPGPRVAVVGLVHGNEIVGGGVLAKLRTLVEERLTSGALLLVRANERAAESDTRHTQDGNDMNRLWDADALAASASLPAGHRSYEQQRVLDLHPLIASCDAILDLHSTSQPAAPFLLVRDDQAHLALARQLNVEKHLTGLHENVIMSGGVLANVGLRLGEYGGRIGVTYEAGQHLDPDNVPRALEVTERFLEAVGVWQHDLAPPSARVEVFEVTDRFLQSPSGATPFRFVGFGDASPPGRTRQLRSFERIQAGDPLVQRGPNEVVRAEAPFTMVMPSPTTAPGTDLYYVSRPRHGGLTGGRPRTDEQAAIEANAIERMFDLLADDEFARGSSWVSSDSLKLFDLCASVVGRTARLRADHPHRRVTVVGRGQTHLVGQGRRTGQKYREAMRRSIAEGLPIERIQLLRGAPLGWIDAITRGGMRQLLAQRQQTMGDAFEGVRMRVSARRAHTAAMLVAGDLEHALATGDSRHVRVALIIEAILVEPAGGSAKARAIRTGIVSARPEVLNVAQHVLAGLRAEHHSLVTEGALAADGAVRSLLAPDGAIEATADAEAMRGVRRALLGTQLQLWCDLLQEEAAASFSEEHEVGQWLARVMARTGILDAHALRELMVEERNGRFHIDPNGVSRARDRLLDMDVDAFLPPPVSQLDPHPDTVPPLRATDVDADRLERWVGWKRFVRDVEVVPSNRGKEVNLAFDVDSVRSRVTRWMDNVVARADGSREVMVWVAGNGLTDVSVRGEIGEQYARAHTGLLAAEGVSQVRAVFGRGASASWSRRLIERVRERSSNAERCQVYFDPEIEAAVNVALRFERERGASEWLAAGCVVTLSDIEFQGRGTDVVAIWSDAMDGGTVNGELLQFARRHCEALLHRLGHDDGSTGSADAFQGQVEAWLRDLVRTARKPAFRQTFEALADERRAAWLATTLGVSDPRLVQLLASDDGSAADGDLVATAWSGV